MSQKVFICDLNDCKLFLERPVLMPCCGSTICQEHEQSIDIKDGKYKCPVCEEQENYPQNGFPLNKKIMKLIENGDHFGEMRKRVLNSIPILESIIKEHETMNSEGIIYDYFAELRNQVDTHREEIIEQIYNKSAEILALLRDQEEIMKKNSKDLIKMN